MINLERSTLISPLPARPAGLTLCVAKCASATPFLSSSYALFHFPYPASPLFATRLSRAQSRDTKTTGVCTNSSQFGTCNSRLPAISFLFTFFHTLLHSSKSQPFCFPAIPNSFTKTPRWGVGSASFTTNWLSSAPSDKIPSPPTNCERRPWTIEDIV